MKLDSIGPICVTVTLSATDCLALTDALDYALWHDQPPDRDHVAALRSVFLACSVLAAFDTIKDNQVPEAEMIADARRVWGPLDHSKARGCRATVSPQQSPE